MAEIVRQAEVLKNVIDMLKKEFGCQVYAEEVKESFKRPCFFIMATSVMSPKTVNWMNKELTITLEYYAKQGDKNEITYMDVVDRVQMLLPVGIQTGERFLKISSIEDDRIGEADDILQITIAITYTERTNNAQGAGEIIDEVDMNVIDSKENHFPDVIKKQEDT